MEAVPLNTSLYKEALIVLGAAGIVIPLFHRLHVSSVLGFMLVGVAVGPFGLALRYQRPSKRSPSGRLHAINPIGWWRWHGETDSRITQYLVVWFS